MNRSTAGLEHAEPESLGLDPAGLDRLDAAVQEEIDRRIITGAVLLIGRHGKIARATVLGSDDIRGRRPLHATTQFRIFSMTKPIVALAASLLAGQGRWQPDDPITRFLPELASPRLPDGGRAQRPPTMQELLTQTAGFFYGGDRKDPLDRAYRAVRPLRARSSDEFISRVAAIPLAFEPGTRWRYGIALDLVGVIIERISGLQLPQFLRRNLFTPLGMHDTGFAIPGQDRSNLATLRYSGKVLKRLPLRNNPVFKETRDVDPPFALGGGGLVSTAADYAKFCQLLLNRGAIHHEGRTEQLVEAAALQRQMSNHLPATLRAQPFQQGHMRFRPGFGYGYGGAVIDDPHAAGLPVGRGTYFWDGAANTWFWVDPENDLFMVGMTQLLSWNPPSLQERTQHLMAKAIVKG